MWRKKRGSRKGWGGGDIDRDVWVKKMEEAH